MKYIICFLILPIAAFSKDLYQKHLPLILYEHVIQHEFFDGNLLNNSVEKQYGSSINTITVKIEVNKKHGQYAVIDYWFDEAVDNCRGLLLAYQNGKLIGCVIFDAEGLDYIADSPYSIEEEEETMLAMLTLLDTGKPPESGKQ